MLYWPILFGQDGWILALFFFCEFMDLDVVSVHKHAKNNLASIQPPWPHTWSITHISHPLGSIRCIHIMNRSFIDQICSVKMAGYWPRSFFACLETSTPSPSINEVKRNFAGQYSTFMTSLWAVGSSWQTDPLAAVIFFVLHCFFFPSAKKNTARG